MAETVQDWPQAAIAIAGIALVGSVVIIALWQALATWRARMSGSREEAYRRLAEQVVEAQRESAARLDQLLAELRALREALASPARRPSGHDDAQTVD
jgi:uncharacterized membrane protein YccC